MIFRHSDAEHPHIHLLANRIKFDGGSSLTAKTLTIAKHYYEVRTSSWSKANDAKQICSSKDVLPKSQCISDQKSSSCHLS
jgi:hypothetical protein